MSNLIWLYRWSSLALFWAVIGTTTVQAEPAKVFQPIVQDIQQQLPEGLQMRLPAYLPEDAMTLHPVVQSSSKGLEVYLSPKSNCNTLQCSVGEIAVMTQESFLASWSHQLKNAKSIRLSESIQGYYLTLNQGEEAYHYVLWEQDGLGFVLVVQREGVSQAELIRIAASASSEPPIVKTNTNKTNTNKTDTNKTNANLSGQMK